MKIEAEKAALSIAKREAELRLAGDKLTYADLAVGAAVSVLDYLGEVDWEVHEILKEWYTRLKSRPSFRPLLADRLRGLPPVSHYVDLDF